MNTATDTAMTNFHERFNTRYEQMNLNYQTDSQSLWLYMQAAPRPCFTSQLLSEIQHLFGQFYTLPVKDHPVKYLVAASGIPDVFNLGGDLDKFSRLIKAGDRDSLHEYAVQCLDVVYECSRLFYHGITTISLIQGSALGGGFEAALACNVIVAEKSTQIGFPEILFNLFPGMGAYSYLSRRVSPAVAEKIISSGRIYSGEELHAMGVVDVLAEDGEGENAVNSYIKQHATQRASRLAMQQAYMYVNPVSLVEMRATLDIWVDTAINLDERSLRIMQRLMRAQNRKMSRQTQDNRVA